jgi:hypothetical protein
MSRLLSPKAYAAVQEFLNEFPMNIRRKGESYFRRGCVSNLVLAPASDDPVDVAVSAMVQGRDLYSVNLFYDEVEGWFGECTCPLEMECKHIYAVMKAWLAELSAAQVRELSSRSMLSAPAPARRSPKKASAAPQEPEEKRDLSQMATAALGRALSREEARFIAGVQMVYRRSCTSRRISRWDFDEMGLTIGGYGWDALKIWPSFPKDEHEFWLYVANAVLENKRQIPRFTEPFTNLERIHDQMRRWRRLAEIEQWTQTLESIEVIEAQAAASKGDYDLRLKLLAGSAVPQWKRPGSDGFEVLKNSWARQALEDYRHGGIQFLPEAEFLWETFQRRLELNRSLELNYQDPDALNTLNRLVRLQSLNDRIVTGGDVPLARSAEPLQWRVTPDGTPEGDYRFRLTLADGQPAPPLLCALPGNPPLYLTSDTLFPGPALKKGLLNPRVENLIPAPAIETQRGMEFLRSIGAPIPAHIRERVRHVPMEISIRCELVPIYPGSTTEDCAVTVHAKSSDGLREEAWNGERWHEPSLRGDRRASKQKDKTIVLYDRASMAEVSRLTDPLGLKFNSFTGKLSLRVTKKFPELFVPWLKSLPPHIKVELAGELASLASGEISGSVRLDVSEAEIDWFDLHVVLDVSDTTLTPQEIKLLLNAKGGYVRLDEKGWRRLKFDLTTEDDEKLARLGLTPHELTAEPQRLHALQLADSAAKKFLPEQQVEQIQRRAGEIKARVTPDLPAGVGAQLRPYQLEGFHFLAYLSANHFGGILADDMGLGKTLQTLAWLLWLREEAARNATGGDAASGSPAIPPSLVVCPKSVMDNWQAEAGRFTPGVSVKVWSGGKLDDFIERLPEAHLHVLNYNQLRVLGESLATVRWLVVILDEGQYIKNPSSQTAQIARTLRAEHRLVLSGTPIENRLLDLWSLMSFAMPGALGSRAHFGRLFDSKEDPFARRRLSARVRPFLLRRTKSQVAKDLPERIEEDLFCEIEGEQKTLYRAELKRAQQMLLKVQTQKQLAKDRFHFLTSLLRLRQICCHPALVKPDSKAESAKLESLMEQLEPLMEEGHKVLVFSQFVEMLALIKAAIAERGWTTFYLAGETENRGELVRQFQSAEGAATFLISLKAGGFGLNLTAASYVVLFDPWWNPAVENQAIDRTHRIGQTSNVIAYRLLIKDSIEEKIRALQKQKSSIAEDVLGEEKFAQSLTLDDLRFLFAD